jgi:virginiamycin B lyase
MSAEGRPLVRRVFLRGAATTAFLIPLGAALASCAGAAGGRTDAPTSTAGAENRDGVASSVGDITVFRDPAEMVDAPTGIIGAGADVWFTSIANSRIGRIRPESGLVETFADPNDQVQLPANICPGSDGRVWFTCLGSSRLGAIDPAANDPALSITTYAHPGLVEPVAMKAASDGRLWFSLRGSNAIGSVDPRAADPMATLETFHSDLIENPSALFIDQEQGIWWVNGDDLTIGHLDSTASDVAGSITAMGPWPDFGSPRAWAMDGAGRLWVTTQEHPGLLTFDPAAPDPASTVRWVTDDRLKTPDGVWFGVDDAVWFVDTDSNAIGRHDPRRTGAASWRFFGSAPDVDGPFDIKPGADPDDGALWFTNKTGNTIGRIQIDHDRG